MTAPDRTPQTIGSRYRAHRLDQRAFAALAGVHEDTLRKAEAGIPVSLRTERLIYDALDELDDRLAQRRATQLGDARPALARHGASEDDDSGINHPHRGNLMTNDVDVLDLIAQKLADSMTDVVAELRNLAQVVRDRDA
jgi:hypothetical protein